MKILVMKGSPHKQGSSNLLADNFIRGATDADHHVEVFNTASAVIQPCVGCNSCGMSAPCIQKDDGALMREMLLASDMVVFVTPLYYFGFSAQLKVTIDRFYSFNGKLTSKKLKSALLAAAWNEDEWTMKDLKEHYLTLCRYLHFQDQGMVLGTGCGTVSMTKRTRFPQKAYEFGKSLH